MLVTNAVERAARALIRLYSKLAAWGDSSLLPGEIRSVRSGRNRICLTVTDFGGLDVGIPQAMRRSIDFAANSHGIGAG